MVRHLMVSVVLVPVVRWRMHLGALAIVMMQLVGRKLASLLFVQFTDLLQVNINMHSYV